MRLPRFPSQKRRKNRNEPPARRQSRRRVFEPLEARRLLAIDSWTGGAGDGLWSSAANWSTGAVPQPADDVSISGNVVVAHSSGSDTINTLTVGAGATLEISGASGIVAQAASGPQVTDDGTIVLGDGGTTGSLVGDVADNGQLTYDFSGDVTLANAVSGTGTLTITAGAIDQSAAITVATIIASAGAGITLDDPGNAVGNFTATNSATGDVSLTNDAALTIDGISQHGGGTITVANTGAVTVAGAISSTGTGPIETDLPLVLQLFPKGTVSSSPSGAITLTAAGPDAPMVVNANVAGTDAPLTFYATGDLTVGTGVTLDSDTAALTLGADLTPAGAGDNGIGTLSINGTAQVCGATITLRGADENIATTTTTATTATVGAGPVVNPVASGVGGEGMAFDACGNLYVSDWGSETISKVTPSGTVSTFVSSGLSARPTGMAFDKDGNLYVACEAGTIYKVTPCGIVSTFVSSGLDAPEGIAFDPKTGNLYVANLGGNISVVTPSGTVSTFLGGNVLSGSDDVAFDAAGNLYASSGSSIFKVDMTSGAISTFVVPSIGGPFSGLAFDAAGNLYFTYAGDEDYITEVTPSGSQSSISGPGVNGYPTGGLAFDVAGNLYLGVDDGSGDVVKLTHPLPTTQLTVQSSVESRPMSIGGTNDAAVDGINLTNAELARLAVADTEISGGNIFGTITFGDSAQTGDITFSTATLPASAGNEQFVALESASAGAQIILDDGSGSGPALDGDNVGITLTAGTGGIVEAATNTAGTVDIGDIGVEYNSSATLTSAGAIGSASRPLQASAVSLTTVSATGATLGGATAVSYFNAYNTTSGDMSLTNGSPSNPVPLEIDGISQSGEGTVTVANTGAVTIADAVTSSGSGAISFTAAGPDAPMDVNANVVGASTPLTLYATGDLEVGPGITLDSGPVALSLGADVTPTGAGDNGIGTLSIDDGAQVNGGTINVRGADENIASTATVGSAVTGGGDTLLTSALDQPDALVPSGIGGAYVANAGNNTVSVVAPSGSVFPLLTSALGVDRPEALAYFYGGSILYVANAGNNTITGVGPAANVPSSQITEVLGSLGFVAFTLATSGLDQPDALAPFGSNIYVANAGNNTISLVTSSGNVSTFVASGLDDPDALALYGGNLYVANAGNNTISEVTPAGSVSTFVTGGLDDPDGLTFDANGNLYVANAGNNTISEVVSGSVSTFASGLDQPAGLAFDANGNLYVANAGNNTISEVISGSVSILFPSGALDHSDGRVYGDNGNVFGLFVANYAANTVSVVSPQGSVSTFVASGLDGPDGLAFDANNNLYVANYNNNTISEVSPSGSVSTFVTSGLDGPEGLAFDANGNLYVANAGNNTVSEVTPFGSVSTFVSSGLDEPEGLAFDAFGNLYVVNAGNNTITEVAPLVAATTQLTIQSSVESRPMSIGGTNDAAVDGINLTNAELARLITAPAGTITFGDGAQIGDITFSTATLPAGAAESNIVALESASAGGQIILDDGSGGGTALDANGGAVTLTAGTGGIVEAATNTTGTADIGNAAAVTLIAGGALGSASEPLQLAATNLTTDTTANDGNQDLSALDTVTLRSLAAGSGTISLDAGSFLLAGSLLSDTIVKSAATLTGAGAVTPVVSLAPSLAAAVPGQTETLTLNVEDDSVADQVAGFTFTVDWGDGTTQTLGPAPSGTRVSHIYQADGDFAATVTAVNQTYLTSQPTAQNVPVTTVAVEGEDLAVGDAADDDMFAFAPGASGTVAVTLNGNSLGSFAVPRRILAFGLGNGDTFNASASGGAGITLTGEGSPNNYSITFGSLTGPVTIAGNGAGGGDSMDVYATTGNDILSKNAAQVTWGSPATETINYSGIAQTTLHLGSGNDTVDDPGANTTILGGPGHDTILVTASYGNGITINSGTGSDDLTVDLGALAAPVNFIEPSTTSTDTLTVQATGAASIGATSSQITSGAEAINYPANIASVTVATGTANTSVSVTSTSAAGVTVQNQGGTTAAAVDLGNLAGPVNVAGTGGTSLTVNGPSGNNTLAVTASGVQSGTQTVNLDTPVAALTVNTGSGNDNVAVSNLGGTVQSLAVNGGSGTTAVTLNDVGSSAPPIAVSGGSGTTQLQVVGTPPPSVAAQNVQISTSSVVTTDHPSGSTYGQSVTFTATVSTNVTGVGTPTGGVQFIVDGANYGPVETLVGGTASLMVSSLSAGSHTIVAQYMSNSSSFGNSASAPNFAAGVAPAVLTVTANNAGRFYLGTNPPLTDTITGFVNGDKASVVSGAASLTTTATTASPVGSYPIAAAQGTLSAANYQFAFVNGTLTVTAGDSIYVLNSTASGALTVAGNAGVNLSGVVDVDSSSSTAIQAGGNATVKATSIQVVGSYSTSGNATISPKPVKGGAAFADPLAGLAAPGTSGVTNYGSESLSGNSSATIKAGIYSQISVSGNAKLNMSAGTYIIEGGGLTVSGNGSLSGTGVFIFNAGSKYPATGGNYGSVTLSGNGTFNLTAPVAGQAYAGIMLEQPADNKHAISISGNAVGGMTGTIYAPGALLSVSGNAQFKGSLNVGTLSLSGNSVANALTSSSATTYSPDQIRTAYRVNDLALDGTGQTIAIVEAYDDPSIFDSLDAFDQQFGAAPSGPTLYQQYGPASSFLTVINQNGQASPLPAADATGGWATEEALDVEWTHALAPGAQIIVVEANSQALADLMAGVVTAANQPAVSVVSMSWGFQEGEAVLEQDEALYDGDFTTPAGHAPVTFVASTGDYGTADPEYPAFSPNVVAVGGTSLYLNGDGSYDTETGWGYESDSLGTFIGSGGGASLYEPEPAYQQGVQSTGNRTTPDVSLVADPNTGVWIADTYNLPAADPWEVVGGTSLSAPSWAGLIALVDQGRTAAGEATLSSSSGIVTQQALYGLPQTDFNSITSGTNLAYTAAAGYNLVTGLGTPVANLLVPDLIGYQTTSPANLTAADLPASSDGSGSDGSGSGGSGDANVINVFNVFDVVTAGSDASNGAAGRGQGTDGGSTVLPEQSQGTTLSAMPEHDLRAAEASLVAAPSAPTEELVDLGTGPGLVSALGVLLGSGLTDAGADSTHFDDMAGALVAAIHGGISTVKNAELDEFWVDYGDRADDATIGQERDSSL